MKRRYTLHRRAEQQEETRTRIVEATVALHGSVGVRNTTISAIAEAAGVERLTVYRHFPEESDLLRACGSHWIARNAPPEASRWTAITDPVRRTSRALRLLYGYYSSTAPMWALSYRDAPEVPALRAAMNNFEDYLGSVARSILSAWAPRPGKHLRAAGGHAVQFSTWQSLHRQGIGDSEMAALVTDWISAAARRARPRSV